LAGGDPTETVAQIMAATSNIQLVSDRIQELRGLGTTVVGVAVQADSYTVFSVGDSTAFRSADGYLGVLTEADRREDPHRPGSTVLTQTLSAYTPTPRPHIEVFPIVRPIRLLLCSDGLTDPLDLDQIRAKLEGTIGEPGSAEYATALLVQAAIDEGGPDNISVIVVDIVPSGDRTPSLAVEANDERRADT
jgi:serine/threonine protein phosphatase PrpC